MNRALVIAGPTDGVFNNISANAITANTLAVNQLTGGAITGIAAVSAEKVNNVRAADQFPGASADVQIKNAMVDLPLQGGIVNAHFSTGSQNFAADPFVGMTKPVTVVLGAGTYSSLVNLSIPINVTLSFEQGAILSMAGGTTATINGDVVAPMTKIFDGAGTVTFGVNSQVREFYPQWWGALNYGGTDASPGINAAIAAARSRGGGTVRLVSGSWSLASSINLTEFTNASDSRGYIHLLGDGFGTKLYAFINGAPVLDLTGSNFMRISNFLIRTWTGFVPTELILLARDSTNASAENNLLEQLWLEGTCSHALVVCLGSETNRFFNCVFNTGNDGPAFSGCMSSSTPPGGNGTSAGWLPNSPFTAIGTGNGGNGNNTFLGCHFLNSFTSPQTRALFYAWGMQTVTFYGCFFTINGTTVDLRVIASPAGGGAFWQSSATFDSCFDESSGGTTTKSSVFFSYPGPGFTSPSINGCHVRNCAFFSITSDDNVWIDDLELSGGHTGFQAPTMSFKVDVWHLENSRIFPSEAERTLNYRIRNLAAGITFGPIPLANITFGGAVTSFQHLDVNTGTLWAQIMRVGAFSFAGLPSGVQRGSLALIIDSTVNTWGSVIAGAGTHAVLGFFNGTNWTVAAT